MTTTSPLFSGPWPPWPSRMKKFPPSSRTTERAVIERSRNQKAVIKRSRKQLRSEPNNDNVHDQLFERRAGPGPDRIYTAFGLRGAGFGGTVHRRWQQREG